MTTQEKIQQIRDEIQKIEDTKKPLKEKLINLLDKDKLERFKPIIERIKNGDTFACKSTWSSPFYEIPYYNYKRCGYNNIEDYIMSNAETKDYTFDKNEMLMLSDKEHYLHNVYTKYMKDTKIEN